MTSPLKVAIVGGGPSAFYCASRIFSRLPPSSKNATAAEVHIYDRLWAPHGLVRYGVAPDHPEVKNCKNKFDLTAQNPGFRFFGNVNIVGPSPTVNGTTLPLSPPIEHSVTLPISSLFSRYSHLVFSTGASVPRTLPPQVNATPAISLVHWYTAHPSLPAPPPLSSISHLTIIGHGNVSLDIARLLFTPLPTLQKLDIPTPVLEIFSQSTIKHISIVSRRGPAEVSFTAKELREMLSLPTASLLPIPTDILIPPPKATRQQSRILDLLRKGSTAKPGTTDKTWSLEFFRSPLAYDYRLLRLGINQLDEQLRAKSTGLTENLHTDHVIGSVGYRSEVVEPNWFNIESGTTRNEKGRVIDASANIVPRVYASGWAAIGAKGVIATTMMDAYSVAETIISDHFSGNSPSISVHSSPMNLHPNPGIPPEVEAARDRIISYKDWRKIEKAEESRGQRMGKERERMNWTEVQSFLGR